MVSTLQYQQSTINNLFTLTDYNVLIPRGLRLQVQVHSNRCDSSLSELSAFHSTGIDPCLFFPLSAPSYANFQHPSTIPPPKEKEKEKIFTCRDFFFFGKARTKGFSTWGILQRKIQSPCPKTFCGTRKKNIKLLH